MIGDVLFGLGLVAMVVIMCLADSGWNRPPD